MLYDGSYRHFVFLSSPDSQLFLSYEKFQYSVVTFEPSVLVAHNRQIFYDDFVFFFSIIRDYGEYIAFDYGFTKKRKKTRIRSIRLKNKSQILLDGR